MDDTEAIHVLSGVRDSKLRVKALMERRYDCYTMALQCRGFSSGGGSGALPVSQVETAVIKLQDMEREICEEIDYLTERTQIVERLISSFPDSTQKDVLKYRYLNCWSFFKIATAMHYERTQVWRIHGEAVKEFANRLDELNGRCATSCNIDLC